MNYRIDIHDTYGRLVASFTDAPLVEAVRTSPDRPDRVSGMLPDEIREVSHGDRIRVFVDGALFCEAPIVAVAPHWSETSKLILDRYVRFPEVIEFTAQQPDDRFIQQAKRAYANCTVAAMVKDLINTVPGSLHYTVAHSAFPEGAEREWQKLCARKSTENELEFGGIASGQWVDFSRIDASGAYAIDGDTIAGLVVDGVPWPDLRLMMIDAEETSRNAHAIKRHPEVAAWTSSQYNASFYKQRAEFAKLTLQGLIDEHGIELIELNPHKNRFGEFDDRVDAYGRYVGLVYGGQRCFNAAMIETGAADVYLYEEGRYHVPEMELKDFYSYAGQHSDSIEPIAETITGFDAGGPVLESIAALAYAAGGCTWFVDTDLTIHFRRQTYPDRVWFYNPVEFGVTLGSDASALANAITIETNPVVSALVKSYPREDSINEYGEQSTYLEYFGISREDDADKLASGLLDDVSYPNPDGTIVFYHGNPEVRVGELVEIRGAPVRRVERKAVHEWGNRFDGRIVGRVREVTHRFCGETVTTRVALTSPLRSVADPLAFIIRSQPSKRALFQFRLDDLAVGLDMGYHLD
ncbi:MAG: thermonuclease family protein [Candidatus Hydrogenedentes bacterium]|nr:thermonuclease family protein [Candidatus Hydrogenedentota bacterium]